MRKENPVKYADYVVNCVVKCKCSHSIIFHNGNDRELCSWCGKYVYKDSNTEFKYKLKENINKLKINNFEIN